MGEVVAMNSAARIKLRKEPPGRRFECGGSELAKTLRAANGPFRDVRHGKAG
jgi:hypothetical protein